MKHIFICAWVSTVLVLSVAAEEASVPRVTVHGTATTEVVPDQMVWSLHIESKGPRLEAVANDQTKMVQKTLEFLQKSKIEPKALQTSRMQFGENWTYSSSSRVRDGYVASTDISFKTTDLERYSELWLGLAEMPAVSIRMVSFDHTKRIEFQNQTREKAILAAKEKAANSAKALGAEIGAPLLLEEDLSPSEGWQPYLQNRLANNVAVFNDQDRGAMGSLAPGTIPITIRVKAAFQLVSRGK